MGEGGLRKIQSVGEIWIFSGTTKYNILEKSSFDEFSTKHATLPYLA